MTEFFSSTRWAMKPEVAGYDGGLIFAAGLPLHSLERRKLAAHPHLRRHLLDPQVYLSGLNVARSADACTKLASYGWFDAKAAVFDSAKQKQSEWTESVRQDVSRTWSGRVPTEPAAIEDRLRICIEVQQRLGCEAIILPAPLATESTRDFSAELVWLDLGLELAARIAPGVPRIATVALSDVCVRGVDPWTSAFLDTVLDQVTARAPEGAYLIIEQASHVDQYESHGNTLGALLRLVRDCRAGGVQRVVVPFAGVAGLLAAAVGAETWSTGWYRGQRRLRLSDFEDSDEIRRAAPTFYAHPLAGEVHLKTDLDTIVAAKLLDRVADKTEASDGLLRALRQGQVVASVPDWAPRPGNVSAAREHFARVLIRETATLRAIDPSKRLDAAKTWLDNAIAVAAAVSAKGEFNVRTTLGHQRAWRQALEGVSGG
jgi:hypothetical protein